jgi:laccase
MWFFHCHLDPHVPMGLGMVFHVDSGTTAAATLPVPPADWVGVCDAQNYATAAAAAAAAATPAPAPASAPALAPTLAPAPGSAPAAATSPRPAAGSPVKPSSPVEHKPSPNLPQHRGDGRPTSTSASGPRATGHHLTGLLCTIILFFVLHERKA